MPSFHTVCIKSNNIFIGANNEPNPDHTAVSTYGGVHFPVKFILQSFGYILKGNSNPEKDTIVSED